MASGRVMEWHPGQHPVVVCAVERGYIPIGVPFFVHLSCFCNLPTILAAVYVTRKSAFIFVLVKALAC
jgi:hypothetical protein